MAEKWGDKSKMDNGIFRTIEVLAWPATILLLTWFYRREIKAALGRIEKAKLPGGAEFAFGNTSIDKVHGKIPLENSSKTTEGNWSKPGNVYWLGHDIMWTIDAMLRGAPHGRIVHGITQSCHHLKEIGLENSSLGSRLKQILERANGFLEADWTPENRNKFALDLRRITDQLGMMASAHQPEFASHPRGDRSPK